jgi:hypothetical protein
MNRSNHEMVITNGITITNQCYQCMQLNELCGECLDKREAQAADIAHEIVDERNLTYLKVWSKPKDWTHDIGANHHWTERDDEYVSPVVDMADRFFNLEDAMELQACETVCITCHYVCNKHTVCPNCN